MRRVFARHDRGYRRAERKNKPQTAFSRCAGTADRGRGSHLVEWQSGNAADL